MSVFLNNKYTRIYNRIIERAQQRIVPAEYTERHHIIPECFFINRRRKGPPGWIAGDPETKKNKVRLTGREHFLCHLLLTKMTIMGKDKMNLSHWRMCNSKKYGSVMSSTQYETARNNAATSIKLLLTGRKISTEALLKRAITNAMPEKVARRKENATGKKQSLETIEKRIAKTKGLKRNSEFKQQLSERRRGKLATKESKEKMSQAHRGNIPGNKGKKMSDQQRETLSKAHLGKKLSAESIAKREATKKAKRLKRQGK